METIMVKQIKTEMMDLPDGRGNIFRERISKPIKMWDKNDYTKTDVLGDEIVYEIVPVYFGGERKYYGVNVNDKGLFTDLIQVSETQLNKWINEKVNKLVYDIITTQEMDISKVIRSIKQLNWFNEIPSQKILWVPNNISFSPVFILFISTSLWLCSVSPVMHIALSPTNSVHFFNNSTRSETTKTLCPLAAYAAAKIATSFWYISL